MTARKVMLLGEIGVGKSSLVKRLVFDRFETDYKPTLGVDVYRYEVPAGGDRPAMASTASRAVRIDDTTPASGPPPWSAPPASRILDTPSKSWVQRSGRAAIDCAMASA